jgi:hypothetical protein
MYVLIWAKNGLGYILGDFLKKSSSGHPVQLFSEQAGEGVRMGWGMGARAALFLRIFFSSLWSRRYETFSTSSYLHFYIESCYKQGRDK